MSDTQEIIIQNAGVVRERMTYAWELTNNLLQGGEVTVTVGRPQKSRAMERKYHAMIRDIHRSAFRGNSFEGVKALLVAEFAAELKSQGETLTHPGETVYSHKLQEWVTVRPSTKKFRKSEGIAFIEYLYMIGTELNVTWSQESITCYEEYREAA